MMTLSNSRSPSPVIKRHLFPPLADDVMRGGGGNGDFWGWVFRYFLHIPQKSPKIPIIDTILEYFHHIVPLICILYHYLYLLSIV